VAYIYNQLSSHLLQHTGATKV